MILASIEPAVFEQDGRANAAAELWVVAEHDRARRPNLRHWPTINGTLRALWRDAENAGRNALDTPKELLVLLSQADIDRATNAIS